MCCKKIWIVGGHFGLARLVVLILGALRLNTLTHRSGFPPAASSVSLAVTSLSTLFIALCLTPIASSISYAVNPSLILLKSQIVEKQRKLTVF